MISNLEVSCARTSHIMNVNPFEIIINNVDPVDSGSG